MKILLVEDDQDIIRIALMALQDLAGHTVCCCVSGEAALEKLSEFSPEVILLDYMLPGQNGLEIFSEIQRLPVFSKVPVIFMSARVQREQKEELLEGGAAGIIEKPFDPMMLSGEVESIVYQQG